jgi:hypothetical protein
MSYALLALTHGKQAQPMVQGQYRVPIQSHRQHWQQYHILSDDIL